MPLQTMSSTCWPLGHYQKSHDKRQTHETGSGTWIEQTFPFYIVLAGVHSVKVVKETGGVEHWKKCKKLLKSFNFKSSISKKSTGFVDCNFS